MIFFFFDSSFFVNSLKPDIKGGNILHELLSSFLPRSRPFDYIVQLCDSSENSVPK